ncbi:MAG: hypothetical protein OEY49_11105 [Candidatus Heimdallarchaeota archaeon]|nr:hypothetical protein [Candidatus Heimdallarchaeota archaeon]
MEDTKRFMEYREKVSDPNINNNFSVAIRKSEALYSALGKAMISKKKKNTIRIALLISLHLARLRILIKFLRM